MKKEYSKEDLDLIVSKSYSWSDVCRFLNKVPATRISKFIKEKCDAFSISYGHFDRQKKNKDRRVFEVKTKICSVCGEKFQTSVGSKSEKTYCSQKCSNSNMSPEVLRKRGESIKKAFYKKFPNGNKKEKPTKEKKIRSEKIKKQKAAVIRRACAICDAKVKEFQSIYCSRKCSNGALKISAENGTHSGWKSRNKLSYPERFFKKVFELNGFNGKFIINSPIQKKVLGFNCASCYFLDFHFPSVNLDVEIDGKQHSLPERMTSDKVRDDALIKNGYIVHRIPWRSINNPSGKEFIRTEIKKLLAKIKDLEQQLA